MFFIVAPLFSEYKIFMLSHHLMQVLLYLFFHWYYILLWNICWVEEKFGLSNIKSKRNKEKGVEHCGDFRKRVWQDRVHCIY